MLKLVIFDIGQVLIKTDFPRLYTDFAKDIGISPEFVANYHQQNMSELLLGNITLKDFLEVMHNESGKTPEQIRAAWLSNSLRIKTVNTELLAIIDELRKTYKLCTLTNLTPTRVLSDVAQGIYEHFDANVLSCDEHLKKPDPEFYKIPLAKFNVQPEEAIFIDDRPELVEVARSLGMKGIAYEDNEQFKREFEQLRHL